MGTGRADFARASEVDPQCVLIFEADLRNPLTIQKTSLALRARLARLRGKI